MPADIAISAAAPRSSAAAPVTSIPRPSQPDPAAVAAASKRPLVDPRLHLDLALNLVVLQFINDKGDVTSSIPTASQIKAYKSQQAEPHKT